MSRTIHAVLLGLIASAALQPATSASAASAAQPCDQPIADVYVAANGNDAWNGLRASRQGADGPVATVAAAMHLLRALKPTPGQPRIAMLRGGRYELAATLHFEPEDSGSPDSPIIYCGYPNETAILSGGFAVKNWSMQSDGTWSSVLPEMAAGDGYLAQLIVDGERRSRARLPKEGLYGVVDAAPAVTSGKTVRDAFHTKPGELNPVWAAGGDAEVLTLNIWSASRYKLMAVDSSGVAMVDGQAPPRPPHQLNKGRRYYVENVPGSATEPGEWEFAHFSGRLRYHPMPGETPAATQAIVPRLTRLVEIGSAVENAPKVHDLTFTNLTFSDTNWVLPAGGALVNQSAASIDAAILVQNAAAVSFDAVRIVHTAGAGLEFGPGTAGSQIANSLFFDLGAGGVKLASGSGAAAGDPAGPHRVPAPAADGNRVVNNVILSGGRIHPTAAGLWVGRSSANVLSHNTIRDFYYTGISVGWTWGDKTVDSSDNLVEANRIDAIGQGLLSDMGGIYTLGNAPGVVIRGNWISDVRGHTYGGTGFSLDEGSADETIEGNLVDRTSGPSLSINYGNNNLVRSNVFANSQEHSVTEGPPKGGRPLILTGNVILALDDASIFDDKWRRSRSLSDRNVYWSSLGAKTLIAPNMDLTTWRQVSGKDASSVVDDPLLTGLDDGHIHVEPTSPALPLGFSPFDVSDAGAHLPPGIYYGLKPSPPLFRNAGLTPITELPH